MEYPNVVHGNRNSYLYHHCRCAACRRANGDYLKAYRAKRLKVIQEIPASREHGTNQTYNFGCRCDSCTRAHAVYQKPYMRAWKARKRMQLKLLAQNYKTHHEGGLDGNL